MILVVLLLAALGISAWTAAGRLSGGALRERLLLTWLFGAAALVVAVELTGAAGLIARWPLVALSVAVAGLLWSWGLRVAPAPAAWGTLRWRDPALLAAAVGLFAFILSAWIALRLPSWSWDCVWYHQPMTFFAIQTGSTAWVDTHVLYVNGYPKAVELIGAWLVALVGDSRLDDGPQLLVAPLGALAIAAWARRFGASRELALGAGAAWLALPAVALQLHTTHADVAGASFFLAGLYFLFARPFDRPARVGALLGLALYAATKNLGLFHLALLAPLLVVRLVRARVRGGEVLLLAVIVLVGGQTYLRNTVKTGNPLWPARVALPLTGQVLPGELDEAAIAGPPAFFRGEGAFTRMVKGWFLRSENYFPDVREGPFGLVFPWLLLPALLAFLAWLAWRRERWSAWTLVAILAVSIVVPAAWWGRFILAVPALALASLAALQAVAPAWLRVALSLLLAGLSAEGLRHAWQGYRVVPSVLEPQEQSEARLRAAIGWLWPPHLVELRERELGAGEVIAHDASIAFLGELWNRRVDNRVVYVPDGADSLERLLAARPKWVAVGWQSSAIRQLAARPQQFQPLFDVPLSEARIFRVIPPP